MTGSQIKSVMSEKVPNGTCIKAWDFDKEHYVVLVVENNRGNLLGLDKNTHEVTLFASGPDNMDKLYACNEIHMRQ